MSDKSIFHSLWNWVVKKLSPPDKPVHSPRDVEPNLESKIVILSDDHPFHPMADLMSPVLPEQITILEEDLKEVEQRKINFVITIDEIMRPEDGARPVVIREPTDGSQVGRRQVQVVGWVQPGSLLAVDCNDFHAETVAGPDGNFIFQNVQLQDGWNDILVQSLTHRGMDASIQIYRQDRPLLFIGRTDPYSRSILNSEDEVIRCKRCKNFSRLDSWQLLPGCGVQVGAARCNCQEYWTRQDDSFYEDDTEVEVGG